MSLTLVRFALSLLLLCPIALLGQQVDPLSLTSLKLLILHDNVQIGSATGTVLLKGSHHYLLTNRHVVLACTEDKNANNVGGWLCANKLVITYLRNDHHGWIPAIEDLYDAQNNKRWLEHPTLQTAAGSIPGSSIDLIALPLTQTQGADLVPLNLELAGTQILLGPSESVSIVGFPLGLGANEGLPLWKNGTIASDLDVDYEGKERFLLDTTSRAGMSGAPVYAKRTGSYSTASTLISVGNATKFLGIYSEQSERAEIGIVWKAIVVKRLYDSLP
jgi:hypothetical protein